MTLPEFDDLLAEISERAFSSGWQSGIEFELWLIATGAKEPVLGRTTVTVLELERLRGGVHLDQFRPGARRTCAALDA